MNRSVLTLTAATLLAVGLPGCGVDSRTLAHVGKDVITVDDYMAGARGVSAQYPFGPDSAKSVFLDDLIRRKLLIEEAANRGLFDDSLTVRFRKQKEEELLAQQIGAELAPADIPVSEGEVSALYEARKQATHVQLIYAFSENSAQGIAEQLKRGADFGELADRLNPPGMLPAKGDIGDQLPGNLVSPLDDYVRTAKPGSIIGPLNAPTQGWFLLKIVARHPHAEGSLEAERGQLADMLRQRKQRGVAIARYKRLQRGYDIELAPGGPQLLFQYFNQPRAGGDSSVTATERAAPLAHWVGFDGPHSYTFGDALLDLQDVSAQKPNALLLPSIEQWILLQCTRRVQTAEARRRGFTLDPRWKRTLDETVNNYVLDALYSNAITNVPSTPSVDDARLAYVRDQNRFEKLDRVQLQALEFPDSAAVQKFLQHAGHQHGGDLHAIAATMPGAPPVRDLDIAYPTSDPDFARLESTLLTMNRGDALGPFPAHGKLVVAMLMAKSMHVAPFEALSPAERAQLDQEGVEFARERRFLALLDELKRRYPVVRNDALLKKLPWPVTA